MPLGVAAIFGKDAVSLPAGFVGPVLSVHPKMNTGRVSVFLTKLHRTTGGGDTRGRVTFFSLQK